MIRIAPFLLLFLVACRSDKEIERLKKQIRKDIFVYETTFYPDDKTWLTGDYVGAKTTVADGYFKVEIDTVDWFIRPLSPCSTVNYEYSITAQVKVHLTNSRGVGYAGVVFDYIDMNFYKRLLIGTNGTFFIQSTINGVTTDLMPTTLSNYINKQDLSENKIELRHTDFKVQVLINDYFVASVPIPELYAYGQVGLASSTSWGNYYTPLTAKFDYFVLKKINPKR